MPDTILTLETSSQRLRVLPTLGAGIASWEIRNAQTWQPMLRPWDGVSEDRYTFACFPLVPWSNRISGGGFGEGNMFYQVLPNRVGEPYPIHGDGWLQPWTVTAKGAQHVVLRLESECYKGNPYHYEATLTCMLGEAELNLTLTATHLGDNPLPYGLGLHPYFLRNESTRLTMPCSGVWLSGDDPLPVAHTEMLPPGFDYRQPAPLNGQLIDHCLTGWSGQSDISYPDHCLQLEMTMRDCDGYVLFYRPPLGDFFCMEPITHPIDAFHLPGQPGLKVLNKGEFLTLETTLRVRAMPSAGK